MLARLRAFPAVAAAVWVPAGTRLQIGGVDENDRPFALHIVYVYADGSKLLVRNKNAPVPIDPKYPPPFVTIDTLREAIGQYDPFALFELGESRNILPPHLPAAMKIDGIEHSGFRVELGSCSAVEIDWGEQKVQCVGPASRIDLLELRTAGEPDFIDFVSAMPR